ncbi:leucine-rich repeat domain-containing protein [Kordia sp.]|uniref:leucine-rich repeat domain-containing protein n=1 Tax=Kordia sp. TaxID=1965332 RepID=UPI003B5BA8E5
MSNELHPKDFENELEYVETVLGFKLDEDTYSLNEKGELLKLTLHDKGISNINFVANLTSLAELNLSENQMSDLSSLSNLTSLTKLNLSYNQISDLSSLSNLTSLIELSLSNNQIQDIAALSPLTSLIWLNLSHNKIVDIGVLSLLTSLTYLNLSYNQVHDISILSNITKLILLDVYDNQVKDINCLSNLVSLEELSLSFNQIQDLTALKKLKKLEKLHISSNLFKDISVLKNLLKLNTLFISFNQLGDFSSISTLTSLKYLSLSGCNLKKLDFLENLTQLIGLYISNNLIKDITILSKLTLLRTLKVDFNLLTNIDVLNNLISLRNLNLSNNQIIEIGTIAKLKRLNKLQISNNPIKNVPETVLNSSAQEIVRWLQENEKITQEEKRPLKDVKVLLLGNTYIGKSNLLFLWQQRYGKISKRRKYPKKSNSTHGLVYEEMRKTKKAPLLHIWDFGGQEYFHATHQLFFSPDALHVLLWSKGKLDTRKKDEVTFELDYWLRCSEQLSEGDSPIEMVMIENRIDHKDEKGHLEFYTHFPEKKYLEKFNIYSPHEEVDTDKLPFMLNACSVSLLHKKRLEGMFELLEERVDMLYQKNLHPPVYAKIRDGLNDSEKKIWTLTDYKNTFKEKNNTILKTLNKLGCLLYFHEQLPNKIFTQPDLLLNLIYDKILNKDLKKKQGELDENFLASAVEGNVLGLKEKELQRLLSAFKLIFKTKDGSWYAPQYLPEESPAWLQLLKDYTFGVANIIVSSDQYLMNSILLDIFTEYANVIKKDKSYMFWQKGLVIEKEGQLLLVEYDRKQMRLLLYGDQQENNQQLQKEVVDFIIKIVHKNKMSRYELESKGEEADRSGFKNHELKLSGESAVSKNTRWNSDKVKIGVSVDGKYYVNVQQLNDNVRNEIYTIKAFDYDDGSIRKTFSVFQFNQYLDNEYQGSMKKVAISYSKDDLTLVNEFIKNLVPLQDDGLIASPVWYCTDLEAGTEWDKEIKENFEAADIIFFMVSPSFLATNYIKEYEIKTAIQKFNTQKEKKIPVSERIRIVPIRLEYCSWIRKDASINLGQFSALPYKAKPVTDYNNRNEAWYMIIENLRMAIENEKTTGFKFRTNKEIQELQERQVEGKLDNNSN